MVNILVRDLGDDVIERLDQLAADLGLSRNEFLKRQMTILARERGRVTKEGLKRLSYLARDALDEEIMRGAWR